MQKANVCSHSKRCVREWKSGVLGSVWSALPASYSHCLVDEHLACSISQRSYLCLSLFLSLSLSLFIPLYLSLSPFLSLSLSFSLSLYFSLSHLALATNPWKLFVSYFIHLCSNERKHTSVFISSAMLEG